MTYIVVYSFIIALSATFTGIISQLTRIWEQKRLQKTVDQTEKSRIISESVVFRLSSTLLAGAICASLAILAKTFPIIFPIGFLVCIIYWIVVLRNLIKKRKGNI